ncbi:MAG: DNA-directed RNA polymerase subunit delta [Erysipelotrichaceae bacterium]|nr:DNA-directed RNA polymerase subunit delta [Erysipelotrichaceae bacterium]MBQ2690426.1 DNA-directed RNA polymerase subunit delta [Solobacterium sp.]
MSRKASMTDAAYDVLSTYGSDMEFRMLWEGVAAKLQIPVDDRKKKAEFYSDLMMDNRFASLKGNKWDLRNRRTFAELHAKAALAEDAEEDEEEEEPEEENEESPEDQKGEEAY